MDIRIPGLALALTALVGCHDDTPPLLNDVLPPPKPDCIREVTPRTFEVYFVLDVSGSMAPFLRDLQQELVSLTTNFIETDSQGRQTLVDYYVVAFVNDVKWFPEAAPRMTSHIAVQDAFNQAIEAGLSNQNLNSNSPNAEARENMLDALAEVLNNNPKADARMVFIATDAPFAEAPDRLSGGIEVKSNYESIKADLATNEFRIHAFTQDEVDGLTRLYRNLEPLTTLPGSTTHRLSDLTGANAQIRQTLTSIAQDASCN